MKNSQKYLIGLYESLENATPVSLTGINAKKQFLNETHSFTNFNRALGACLNEGVDDGLNAWANETVSKTALNEKVLVNFNAILESLIDSTEYFDSAIHKTTAEDLDYLANLEGAELTSAIQGGALDNYIGFIPELAELNAIVTGAKIIELNENNKNVIYTPFSMLSESADGKTVIRLKGNNYAIGLDGRLYEAEGAVSGDSVNDAIENIPYNDKDDQWELDSPVGMITVSPKEKCIRMNGDVKSCQELKESLSDAVTSAESGVLTDQDVEYLDDLIRICENLDDIALLDEARICENLVDRGSLVIFPNDNGTEISVIRDGKLEYLNNIEDIIDDAVENFSVAKSYLTESFKDKIERARLIEEFNDEMQVKNEETRVELTEMLAEVEDDLRIVDADSPAGEKMNECRNRILNELARVEKECLFEAISKENPSELRVTKKGITYLGKRYKGDTSGKIFPQAYSQETLATKVAKQLGGKVHKPAIDRFWYVTFDQADV